MTQLIPQPVPAAAVLVAAAMLATTARAEDDDPSAATDPAARLVELEREISEASEAGDAAALPPLLDEAAAINLRRALGFAHAHPVDGALTAGRWRPDDDDVPATFDLAITSPASVYRDHLVLGLISAWVRSDPADAQARIRSLPESPYRHELIEHYNGAMIRVRPAEALAASLADLGEPGAIKFEDAALSLVRADLDAAADAIDTVPPELGEKRDKLIRDVARAKAGAAVDDAVDWSIGLRDDHDRAVALEEVVYTWSAASGSAAANRVLALDPGVVRDAALRALVFESSAKNPADAFTWALSIADEKLRGFALSIVAYDWSQSDPEAAQAGIEKAPIDDATRAALLEESAPAPSGQ